jgi:hypothetical protein
VTLTAGSSHALVALTWVSLFLIATGVEASSMQRQRPVSTKTAGETFIISGTLVRDDRGPIEGARVMIAEAKGAGYAISIGEVGVLENPSAITDAKGRFFIVAKRSLFKDRQEFVVVVPLFAGARQPMPLADGDVTVKIDGTTRDYKLGEIGRAHPIVR